jgi:hypothetical protein
MGSCLSREVDSPETDDNKGKDHEDNERRMPVESRYHDEASAYYDNEY